ncbi:MAG: phosphoglucosamine mutase [Actinomycetota bacterium]|jgi:phosphoglucosamine mutase|nr:phosphoglucosamine mutase [Actinomycetota bacterium]
MARLFGTDGVRGTANREITAQLALDLSVAAARVLAEHGAFEGHRPRALVGRDPRASGEFLSAAMMAGLASAGVDVSDVGVLPTPAVAYLTSATGADFGVMISASHNAMPDNGIKFFARGGHKLPDDVEDEIEEHLGADYELPVGADVGRITRYDDGAERYMAHLLISLPHRLDRLHVVVDAAHGAASEVGRQVFWRAGAKVTLIGATPDGLNINDGYGSTHLDTLQAAVLENGADLGVAFDGDADRCLAVDHTGAIVDGDQIMGVLAIAMKASGRLERDTLVATVMSNLGLIQAMERHGISVQQTAVGDRYVLDAMRRYGYNLGGEQSGHVILLGIGTTGDGVLTGLHLAAQVAQTRRSLADLASEIVRLPQVLINVKDVDKDAVDSDEGVQAEVAAVQGELGGSGRVLLRKSGTEPVVRVMIEAGTAELAQLQAERLATVVTDRLAL